MNKVTILFLTADPTDAARLRLGEEFREIQEKLRLSKERERFDLHIRTAVRPQDITQALLDIEPHIVHFSGHGTSHGEICVEDALGHIHPISPNALQLLFKQFSEQVDLVILNACYSAVQARAISTHIKYVIGMQKSIGDRAAIAFSVGFYQAIGAGKNVLEAFDLGRVQISLHGIPENLTPVLISTLPRNVSGIQSGDEPYRIFLGKKLHRLRNVYLRLSNPHSAP